MVNICRLNTQLSNLEINIGIERKDRRHITEGLYRLLADTYTLYLKTQNFQWNVTGPLFRSLHDLFKTQDREMADAVDKIAQRIRALGFPAPGSYREFMRLNSVMETEGVPTAEEMIQLLVEGNEMVSKIAVTLLRQAIPASDRTTVSLLTERIAIHDKNAWILRSHLQN